jgi:hypothetical protein
VAGRAVIVTMFFITSSFAFFLSDDEEDFLPSDVEKDLLDLFKDDFAEEDFHSGFTVISLSSLFMA